MSSQSYDPYTDGWYLLPISPELYYPTQLDITSPEYRPLGVEYGTGGLSAGKIDTLNAHTIQSLIELVYVRVGNDILYEGLNGLDQAIDETSQTLDILADIQGLHNALEVSGLGNFSSWFNFAAQSGMNGNSYVSGLSKYANDAIRANPNVSPGNTWLTYQTILYEQAYDQAASAFFGIPIVPDFIFKMSRDGVIQDATIGGTSVTYESFASNLANLRNALSSRVEALSAIATTEQIQDPNSLLNATKNVLNDLPPEQTIGPGVDYRVAWTDAKLWALDGETIDDGQDIAQVYPDQVIKTYIVGESPSLFAGMSLNGIGVGDGYIDGGGALPSSIMSYHGSLRPIADYYGGGGTVGNKILITYSGRLAIQNTPDGAGYAINPVNEDNAVVNPIEEGSTVDGGTSYYLGSFHDRNDASRAGAIQQNITLAITSAQGLNDTQTEQVRQYMFIFEEYYKSASALLNKITQLIEKFAQGIRPS